jgi:RTX calcium-binding nonapeptide repeat (4 copies)/Cadherin domain/Haemolysin-type calcium binding protein related domain
MISTLPGGDFKISNFDISGVLQSEQEVFVAGNSLLKYYDTHNTHPWTELDVSEDATGNPTGVQVVLTPAAAAAGSVGQVLGSAIGHALAPNNPFVQLAAGTVVGAIGQQLSQAIAQGGLSFDGSGMSIANVFQGFNVTLENVASGSIASFLTAEIGTALGLSGWGGQLFDAAVGGYTGSILSQAVQIGLGNVVGDINWDAALSSSEINIAGAVGSILAHQLVTAHTQAGAIGGQLVGAIGSIIGVSIGQALGLSLDFILPGVGSLIGTILGTWIGDLFAPDPAHPYAESTIDPSTYSYSGHVFYVGGGGNSATSNAMADTAGSVVNAYLTAVGGVALAQSEQIHIGYQTTNPGNPYFWSVYDPQPYDPDVGPILFTFRTAATADEAVSGAALELLRHTEAVGGDLFLKRAHQHSQYTDAMTLAGDLQVAQDYELYLNNRDVINALIAVNPNSAFTAGWVDTFVLVNDLGLNQYSASDFLGGMVTGYLDSVKKAGLAFDPSNVSVKHGSDGSITIEIRVGGNVDVPGELAAFANHTNEIDDASGKTIQLVFTDGLAAGGFHGPASASFVSGVWQVTGSAGNNLWIGHDDAPNSFQAAAGSANILLGGAMADVIHAGDGGDFVDGGAGNDTIVGGAGNDILHGGDGNDTISGGAGNDGLAGGHGNDILQGGAGNDSYLFDRGDGADTVIDNYHVTQGGFRPTDLHLDGGQDSLVFGPGIKVSDLVIQISGNDLIVGIKDPANPNATLAQLTDKITLQNWMDPLDRIETFQFEDGTTLNLAAGVPAFMTDLSLTGGTVAENSANGTVVGTAAGHDLLANATLTYSLTDSSSGRFAINATTGVITVANGAGLDFEAASSQTVTVHVADQNGIALNKNFTIAVTNVNEAPSNATMTGGSVAEMAANGTLVGTVTGVDPDAGSVLHYSLTDSAGGRFAIDPTTGAVTVANGSLLDYETSTSHTIGVHVTDQGGLSLDKIFNLSVTNVNEAPTGLTLSNGSVIEHSPSGTVIGMLNGVDPDGSAGLSYTLTGNPGNLFQIDPTTHALETAGNWSALDYATAASQSVTALVTDPGGLSWSTTFNIAVTPDHGTAPNPDGSTTTTIYDAPNLYSWNSFRTDTDASGNVTYQLGIDDGGGSWQNEYDVAGNQSWSTRITVTSATGQLVSQTINNDDGTHVLIANDVGHSYSWSTFTMQFDANWNYVSVSGTNDDGSHNLDPAAVWSSMDTLLWYSNPYVVSQGSLGGAGDGYPVILDLDGNGVGITPLSSSTAYFDMDGHPGKEHTAWALSGDGILAIDLGAGGAAGPDGVIDQTNEIVFSNWAPGATSDMAALREVFDTNHNGQLDPGDSRWSEFRIWQDANGDGISDRGELRTLDAAGIASIGLDPVEPSQILGDGSAISGLSNFTWKDGHTGIAADVALAYAPAAAGSANVVAAAAFQFADAANVAGSAAATGWGVETYTEQGVPAAAFGRSLPGHAAAAAPPPPDFAGRDDALGSIIGHDIVANADLLAHVGYGWHVA